MLMASLSQAQLTQPLRYEAPGRIGSLMTGAIASLFGLGGFVAVVVGDDLIPLDLASVGVALIVAAGAGAAVLVLQRPILAAIGLALPVVVIREAFGGSWATWWDGYQAAVATSGAAENVFWSAMPAMALFAISGALFVVASLLAGVDAYVSRSRT
jgi:hypothetical protein